MDLRYVLPKRPLFPPLETAATGFHHQQDGRNPKDSRDPITSKTKSVRGDRDKYQDHEQRQLGQHQRPQPLFVVVLNLRDLNRRSAIHH